MKHMLTAVARGGERTDPSYADLRLKLIQSRIAGRLPRFVHTCRDLNEFWGFIQPKFARYRDRTIFLAEEFAPLLDELERSEPSPGHPPIHQTLEKVDSAHVKDAWQKALDRRIEDPEGAITSARTLLESVCKHILDSCGISYGEKDDLPKLHGKTIEQLNLAPSQHTEEVFKAILGSCQTVVSNLGSLRNKLGDAHGKGARHVKPAPRHAELAVNLAGAMASFLLATWAVREPIVSLTKRLTERQVQLLTAAKQQGGVITIIRRNIPNRSYLVVEGFDESTEYVDDAQALIDQELLGQQRPGPNLVFPLSPKGIEVLSILLSSSRID